MRIEACPQCGWHCHEIITVDDRLYCEAQYYIKCRHCHWHGSWSIFKWLAILRWNRKKGVFTVRRERPH